MCIICQESHLYPQSLFILCCDFNGRPFTEDSCEIGSSNIYNIDSDSESNNTDSCDSGSSESDNSDIDSDISDSALVTATLVRVKILNVAS